VVQGRTVQPWLADSPPVLFNMVSALDFHIDRSRTVHPRLADRPSLTFSDSTDSIQTGFIAVTGTVDRPHVRRTCASCT
jgi:hypothetical protein